ncbi:MAG: hypothetical protein V4606_03540 [Patescibacteria group bacterium]
MKQFGPYEIGETIHEDAPVGVIIGINWEPNRLYTVIGEFEENVTSVPAGTNWQYIDSTGKVLSGVKSGSSNEARVKMWCMIDE